jgi:hypothetical protein
MWLARFTLYFVVARGGWNYGYGVNGTVVNRRLTLAEKARRIGTDWFGIVLMIVSAWFIGGALCAV